MYRVCQGGERTTPDSRHQPGRCAFDRKGLTGQQREVEAEVVRTQQHTIRWNKVTRPQPHNIARDQVHRRQPLLMSGADGNRLHRHTPHEATYHLLGVVLLDEGKDAIDGDDGDDGHPQLRHACGKGQAGREPE